MKYLSLRIFCFSAFLFFISFPLFSVIVFASSPKVYVANSGDNSISVIDSMTNAVVTTIPVGQTPLPVVVDSFNHKIYVGNYNEHTISVIDITSNKVISTINLGSDDPESFALSHDGKRLYVAAKNANKVDVIDIATNSLFTSLVGFVYPQFLVLNSEGTRLYVVSTNNPCCTAQDGYVSVIDTSSYNLLATIPVNIAPVGITISPDNTKVYVTNNGTYSTSTVSIIDTNLNVVVNTIPVGVNPFGIAINSTGTRVYVTNTYYGVGGYNDSVHGTVSVIDTATDSVIATIPVGYVPNILDISGDDSKLYVANSGGNPAGNTVSVIDTATNTVTNTITVGHAPWGVAAEKSEPQALDINLSVPLIKQYDLPWGIQYYDSASKWSPQNPLIARWGCALTSSAMILQYYGIKKLPNGLDLNPGNLNEWLKHEKDGYIGDGLLNWVAIQRLSKQAVPVNNITSFDALMYSRRNFEDIQTLSDNLQMNIPGILEEEQSSGGTHYVVAKGIFSNTFLINDPYFHWQSLLEGYNNHFSTVAWYTPSHTDLSYMLLVADPELSISVKDIHGNIVAQSFVQHPLSDEVDGGTAQAHAVSMVYYQTPATGIYSLTVSSLDGKQHTMSSYVYDILGNVSIIGSTIPDNGFTQEFSLFFNKNDSSKDFITKDYSQVFAMALNDLSENFWLGLVDNGGFSSLYSVLTDGQKQYLNGKIDIARQKVQDAIGILTSKEGKGISESAYLILYSDIQAIKTSL